GGAAAAEHVPQLPCEVEAVLHRDVHALAGLGGVGVAGVPGDEHARGAGAALGVQHVVEAVGEAVAHLVDAVPGHVPHLDRVRVEDFVGLGDDGLERGAPHGPAVVLGDGAEVHVHADEVPALARDEQDAAAVVGLDRALGAHVGEVGVVQDVHDAPGVQRLVALHGAADGPAHRRVGAVAAADVLRAHGPLDALVGPGGAAQGHRDGMLLALGDGALAGELPAVVGRDAGRAAPGGPEIVVQHAGLVDDQVGELADPADVVVGAGGGDVVPRVLRCRAPEVHLGGPVGLGDVPLGEAEGLEGLHRAGLDAVGLAQLEPARAALDDAGADLRVLRGLGGGDHAR